MNTLFTGLFSSGVTETLAVSKFLICMGASIVIGIILTLAYMYKTKYTKSFAATLAILPTVVCVIIMMVNGNVGAGVAVAGAFSLVRFRSVPGTAKEIGAIFIAMGAGLITGMGYIGFAFLFSVIIGAVEMIYSSIEFGNTKNEKYKTITITIPEDLNYPGVFGGIFKEYTDEHELVRVKTTNMGSLFRLTYDISMKKGMSEKELIDKLRCRNGNLEICMSKQVTTIGEL